MSHDFQTMPKPCDHHVAAERLAVGPDNRTLYSVMVPTQHMTKPINGDATVTLRFNGKRVPRNHPVYGWDLLWDETTIAPDYRSKIVLKQPLRLRDIIIEVGFVTTSAYCNKCGGRNVVADYSITVAGTFLRAVRRTKLIQKALKFMLTSRCRFYPALTCQLRTYIGRKYGRSLAADDISYQVQQALEQMRAVQDLQARFQDLEPEEILRSVDAVGTVRDPNDPTVLRVTVDVSSPAGVRDKINVGLRVAI